MTMELLAFLGLTANGRTSASESDEALLRFNTQRSRSMNQLKVVFLIALGLLAGGLHADELVDAFRSPPDAARPGVYWYFHDGNQDRQAMTNDLESMQRVGLGSVVFLEVAIGVPAGPTPFMSEPWQENFAHAVRATERLGMEFILGTGPVGPEAVARGSIQPTRCGS